MTLEELMSPMDIIETPAQAETFVRGLVARAMSNGADEETARQVVRLTVIEYINRMPMDAPRFDLEAMFLPLLAEKLPVKITRSSRLQI